VAWREDEILQALSEMPDLVCYNRFGESTMSMTGLTPEQRRLVEQAGDRPVRLNDLDH
jgi:hypothetical protein